VPFTFTLSTPPVQKERATTAQPFRFASKAPARSNQKRNLKLTLPAPLIFKPSTSPELKENARPPKSLALIFNESSSVNQPSFNSRSASTSHTTYSSSQPSSIESKEKQEMLTKGICMSLLRSPSNMCALRRGKRSQYSAVRSSQSTDDATKQEMEHTIEQRCVSSDEPMLLFSAFATATSVSPTSPLSSKRKHEMVTNLQDIPYTESLLQADEHVPKRRCDSWDIQKHLDSSYDTQASASPHTPFSLKRKRDMIPNTHGVPGIEPPSYWSDLNHSEASQQSPLHPVIDVEDASQQEESPMVKRRRDTSDGHKEVEVSKLNLVYEISCNM
jgi:hypothetical protein